jgi:hypothetical protein
MRRGSGAAVFGPALPRRELGCMAAVQAGAPCCRTREKEEGGELTCCCIGEGGSSLRWAPWATMRKMLPGIGSRCCCGEGEGRAG